MAEDASLYALAAAVLDVVHARLTLDDLDPPDRRYVSAGQPAHDLAEGDCSEQLTVQVTRVFSTSGSVTVETPGPVRDPGQMTVEVSIQVVRCAPTLDDLGGAPGAVVEEAAARMVLVDAAAVDAALTAATGDELPGCSSVAVMEWRPGGPQGGVVWGTTVARIGVE